MNDKERWHEVRTLLKSLSVGDTFFADCHPGLRCLPNWSERMVIEHHGCAIVSVWSSNGRDRQQWDVAEMLSNRALDYNPVAKQMAEQDIKRESANIVREVAIKLFRSLDDDREFNADPPQGYTGVRRTYVVLSIADNSVHAEPIIGSDPTEAFTLETFLSRNARVSDIPTT